MFEDTCIQKVKAKEGTEIYKQKRQGKTGEANGEAS